VRNTTFFLILTLGAVAGCTTTKTYDLSDPSDREAVSQKESVRIDLIDGTEIVGYDVRVGVDTLFFAVEPNGERLDTMALSEIVRVSAKKSNPAGTALLIATPVAAVVLFFVVACNSADGPDQTC
jgi:hypothetical protein